MIYSLWDPSDGKYSYFDAPKERYGMGDDLPSPILPKGTAIGVASTEAGRPMPRGARRVGQGEFARGVIAPLSRKGLTYSNSGFLGAVPQMNTQSIGVFLFGSLAGFLITSAWNERRS